MSRLLIVLLLFNNAISATAQEKWTLKQCIDYGLKNHRNNIIYANQKTAADARAKEVLADYLPKVSLTSTLDNNLKLQQSVIPGGIFGPDEIRVSLSQKYNANFVGQLDQVIYDQSLLTGLKANKYNKQKSNLDIVQSQEAIIYNISIAYFQIFVYAQQLEMLEFNKNTYEKQIQIYQLQVSKGVTLQKDLDKVIVNHNNTTSQIRVAQSNLQLAENELKYEMGLPIQAPLSVDLSVAIKETVSLDENIGFTPQSRNDYKLSEVNIKMLEIDQSSIKAEALPKLTAYFRYGAVGFGDRFKGAYDELLPYSAVGLKLSIPILDFYKRNARYKQAEISRMNAEENLKLAAGKFTVEYENARSRLIQARTSVENDRRNVELAESVLKVTDLQFQKGTTDLTDWLNTQHALKDAQNTYLNALYTYYQARIELEKAAGSLKAFHNSL